MRRASAQERASQAQQHRPSLFQVESEWNRLRVPARAYLVSGLHERVLKVSAAQCDALVCHFRRINFQAKSSVYVVALAWRVAMWRVCFRCGHGVFVLACGVCI